MTRGELGIAPLARNRSFQIAVVLYLTFRSRGYSHKVLNLKSANLKTIPS